MFDEATMQAAQRFHAKSGRYRGGGFGVEAWHFRGKTLKGATNPLTRRSHERG